MRAGKFKIGKKPVVQLTSLLDLLFVMIFISLSQQKTSDAPTPEVKVVTKTIIKEKIVEKPVEVVKEVPVEKPKPTKYNITALFNFYGTPSNPAIPSGTYRMSGTYDQASGKLFLGGTEWINQPANYEMVPLGGKVEASEDFFTGRIQFQGCKQFSLRRESSSENTPISGSWKGQYDCTQGATGLTLTIQ